MKYVLHSDTSAIWLYWQVSGATDRGREKTSKPKSSWGWWSIYVGVKLLGHFFLCLTYCVLSCSVVSYPLWLYECNLPGSFVYGDSPGKITRGGCHALLHGIFPTQELNPGLPHCRQILYHLHHQRSPRILGWVAYPFSRETSWPRNWTRVSCIAGGVFTNWATWEALYTNKWP